MTTDREMHCYEYVNRSYDQVRDALRADALGVFQRATAAAASRAQALATTLRVQIGSIELGADVSMQVDAVEESRILGTSTPVTKLKLSWRAARTPELFPTMEAELSVYPLSSEETQLDLHGHYRPPLGALGAAMDALVGHRIAEASVHRFVEDLAERLKLELPPGA